MTLIAGYIYNNTVNIIADSAETITDSIYFPHCLDSNFSSSFGEVADGYDGKIIIEAAQKIHDIDGIILLAYAGNVLEGKNSIKDIKIQYKSSESLSDFLFKYFYDNKYSETEYIIGYHELGKPTLFTYKNGQCHLEHRPLVAIICGAADDKIRVSIDYNLIDANQRKYDVMETLIQTVSILQSLSLALQTINDGIGGVYNGAYISSEGIYWADDTAVFTYSGINFNNGDRYNVFKYNRNNALFIINNKYNRVISNDLYGQSQKELIENWGDSVEKLARTSVANYYVFICYDLDSLVTINNSPFKKNRILLNGTALILSDNIKNWIFETAPGKQIGQVMIHVRNNFANNDVQIS